MAPYLATFLIVTTLLVVGLWWDRNPDTTGSPAVTVLPSTDSSAMPTTLPASLNPTSTPVPVEPSTPASTTVPSTPGSTQPAINAGKHGPRIIAWIRDLGLTGGGGSYQEAFLAELSWGRCGELLRDVDSASKDEVDLPTRNLYRAAAQACLAAFHGEGSLWRSVDAAVEELSGRSLSFDCIDRSVYDLTRTLVKIHRSNPGAILRRGRADDAEGPDCPRLRSVEPASGPATGGYQVRITGEHLPNPAVIHFGEVTRSVPTIDGRIALFTVPPVGQYYDISVWVEGWPYEVMHSPGFTYDVPSPEASTNVEESNGP
ncbi:IPT/TIG domain-containing protein [Actinoplanes sp. NPDC049548]|uniref:IPT/TIG domain-containing protein n=1 Tax=Actinoplanes sp. NPDC049548 TaxID=3155152 RepID=UPI00342FED16